MSITENLFLDINWEAFKNRNIGHVDLCYYNFNLVDESTKKTVFWTY